MHVIQLDHIAINFAGREIFRDLSLSIGNRDRIGLVGPNGAGKSTLFKLITGDLKTDAGFIKRARDITIGYLPQDVDLTPGYTLLEEASILPPALADVEAELTRIEEKLASPNVYNDSNALTRVLTLQERALEKYEELGGLSHANTVQELLRRLGFSAADFSLATETLSGGQKKLAKLVRLVIEAPDVLLLDEPDNHLDLTGKRHLEQFLRNFNGAVVIISHDRYLLDEVATQIAELENGALTLYPGNYSAYATERELRRLRQQQQYTDQQKEIARIEAAIKRFEHWASIVINERHIRQARSRRKMLDRMEANGEIIEKVTEQRRMDLHLSGWRGSTKTLEITDLAMGFDDDLLFVDLNLLLRHGERVGLIGPNGVGKSVLFHLILDHLAPLDGQITIGPSTKIGYYSQEHQNLDPWLSRTPLELIRDVAPRSESDAVAFLLKFLFNYDQTRQPIGTMSGGERSRLQLASMMLQNPNFLLLDEPTNNLDIHSMEVLEQALNDFEGSLLIISHDRYFLDQTVEEIIELDRSTLTRFTGGYTDYLESKGLLH